MYGFHGFHGFVRIFWNSMLDFRQKKIKKSVPIGEIRGIRTLYVCSEKEESSIFATKRSKEWIQTVVHLGVNPVMDVSPHSLQTFVEIPNSS